MKYFTFWIQSTRSTKHVKYKAHNTWRLCVFATRVQNPLCCNQNNISFNNAFNKFTFWIHIATAPSHDIDAFPLELNPRNTELWCNWIPFNLSLLEYLFPDNCIFCDYYGFKRHCMWGVVVFGIIVFYYTRR